MTNLLIQVSTISWMISNYDSFFDLDLEMSAFVSNFMIKWIYSGCRNSSFRFIITYIITSLHQISPTYELHSLRSFHSTEKFPRKEVIQPHLPVRLPCYDFTPVTNPALGHCLLTVSSCTSGVVDFHGVTGGVYKTRERIQRSVLICVY